ncbi:tRNA (adenosine(37)-N6)-threonylcarbamoyltransferase complex ATPase subunit type 1 TsaE [Patescibacteria group bacterium]
MSDSGKAHILESFSEVDTCKIAEDLANKINDESRLVLLRGLLGAGKTTFVKGFAKALGADLNQIKSPTYTYFRTYQGLNKKIVHIDLYRLDHMNVELLEELQEYLDNKENVVVIEWPERVEDYLPLNRNEVIFEHGEEPFKRLLKIKYANS